MKTSEQLQTENTITRALEHVSKCRAEFARAIQTRDA